VIPFRVQFRPGVSLCDQVVYAAKKAIVSGHLRPGDAFPSVRILSKELKINPNTAHKIVAQLVASGLLETRPGIGTVVATLPEATSFERTELMGREIEELVVDAKKLGINLQDVVEAISEHWKQLTSRGGEGSRKR
jgi:DNA-binding transcriptional regulator YhcF (GntR family)